MRRIAFKDGKVVTTKLSVAETINRLNRLDSLRVLTEGYESGAGLSICNKARKAYNQNNGFTGIIHLTKTEKDFLSYCLDSEFNTKADNDTLRFYINGGKTTQHNN